MLKRLYILAFVVGVLLPAFALPPAAFASTSNKQTVNATKKKNVKAPKVNKKPKRAAKKPQPSAANSAEQTAPSGRFSALVVDVNTGKVLYDKNGGSIRYPASLTKMMTLYLTFDALKNGSLNINESMPVSAKAAGQPQTNIALNPSDMLPVKTAIVSLIVRSANDASVVLAEKLGGTEWNFALMMTQKARELGMKDTVFRNPNGLPDNKQYTTAYDMARLGIALRRDFPEYYHYFKISQFSYNGVNYTGHNRVMQRYEGVDGIKTGFIRASGFNLVTSVKKDGYNLVAVIMGGTSGAARDNQMIEMLDRTFAQLESKRNKLAENDNYQDGVKKNNERVTNNFSIISSAHAK